MTSEQRAILQADMRRHERLAMACEEACIREHHEAIAEALAAAIEEKEVVECKLVLKYASPPQHSPVCKCQSRTKAECGSRPGK